MNSRSSVLFFCKEVYRNTHKSQTITDPGQTQYNELHLAHSQSEAGILSLHVRPIFAPMVDAVQVNLTKIPSLLQPPHLGESMSACSTIVSAYES
jgi:hypothetical protein